MARNAASLTDAFTYSNGNLSTASANWGDPQATQKVQVSSNQVCGATSAVDAPARWAGTAIGSNDQWSSAVITGITGGSDNYGAGVIARCSTDTDANRDYYYVCVHRSGVVELGKVVNGSATVLHTASPTFSSGDRIDIECEGTTIRACRNGTPYGGSYTVTDSDLATGTVGVMGRGDPGLSFADDWEGGTITGASPVGGLAYGKLNNGILFGRLL